MAPHKYSFNNLNCFINHGMVDYTSQVSSDHKLHSIFPFLLAAFLRAATNTSFLYQDIWIPFEYRTSPGLEEALHTWSSQIHYSIKCVSSRFSPLVRILNNKLNAGQLIILHLLISFYNQPNKPKNHSSTFVYCRKSPKLSLRNISCTYF